MPITRDQVDKGLDGIGYLDDISYKVLQFLKEHHDSGYNIEELIDEIYCFELPSDLKKAIPMALLNNLVNKSVQRTKFIELILDALVRQELVDKEIKGEEIYYFIHRG